MDNVRARFRQYQNAIEESNIVSKTDVAGIITFVNDEFCKISGYSRDELIGKNHNIVRHPDEPKEKFRLLWETILAKKVYKTIQKNLTKSGRAIYLNTTIIPILNLSGQIEEFVAIRHDVTPVIELNEQLLKTQNELKALNLELEERVNNQTKKLRELNQNLQDIVKKEIAKNEEKTKILLVQSRFASMGEMIANIAHQWRQPLNELSLALFKMKTSVNSSQNSAKDGEKSVFETTYEHCKKLIKNMSNTIEDFRGFFDANQPEGKFWLTQAVDEAVSMVGGGFEREGIELNLQIKQDALVRGRKNELNQVVINLLNNAKDALCVRKQPQKYVNVKVQKDGEFALISISDNGGGIDEGIVDKIFEPYFTTKHSAQGTGIGLYMSRLIIDRFKGKIEIINKKDGACFTLRLPRERDEDE